MQSERNIKLEKLLKKLEIGSKSIDSEYFTSKNQNGSYKRKRKINKINKTNKTNKINKICNNKIKWIKKKTLKKTIRII